MNTNELVTLSDSETAQLYRVVSTGKVLEIVKFLQPLSNPISVTKAMVKKATKAQLTNAGYFDLHPAR